MEQIIILQAAPSVLAYRTYAFGKDELSGVDQRRVTVPADAVSGDLAILVDWAVSSLGLPTLATPSGWTNIINTNNGTTARGAVCWKILSGSDPGTTLDGMTSSDASNPPNKIMLVFAGPWTSATVSTPSSQITDGNPSSQSATASGETAQLAVIGISAVSGASGTFTTASPSFDATILDTQDPSSANHELLVGYKVYTTSPANHTIDKGDQGNANWLASFYVTVS